MAKILVIGAAGQIGSELTMTLRRRYGNDNVVAGVHSKRPREELLRSGPHVSCDCLDVRQLRAIVQVCRIERIYHLAAILSAAGEANPHLAWDVNMNGLYNVLEVARQRGCSVFAPSSIAAFGPSTPADNTPQDTIQRPNTMYGLTNVWSY